MGTFDALADLSLSIEGYRLEPHRLEASPAFTRRTTSVVLVGSGAEGAVAGRGEDVVYGAEDQERFQGEAMRLDLAGEWTLDAFTRYLEDLELFSRPPSLEMYRPYRRWAFESAALDLALRQSDESLGGRLGRKPRRVAFVVSPSLGSPPSARPVEALLEREPSLRFKLDATDAWDDPLVERLAATGTVATVDLKGAYRGTPVDQAPNAELYRRVVDGFPDAWIEDPGRSPETDAVLAGHLDRVTWDAPIHSVDDVLALDHPPRALNAKPSRFGTLRGLLDFYDHCAAAGIALYGGGQFELAEGRRQIQLLASLFHPAGPNDVAPIVFHRAEEVATLPSSPLAPEAFGAERSGFGRGGG